MENITFNEQKYILGKERPKKTHGLRTQAQTCICRPHTVYAGTILLTQLGFQRYKKCKFSTLKTEVWNKSHIVWELFQTSIFQLYKALHGTFSRHRKS